MLELERPENKTARPLLLRLVSLAILFGLGANFVLFEFGMGAKFLTVQ